ncbi:MAG: Ig-like domain-containing protein [Pseudomonadota bacterium]
MRSRFFRQGLALLLGALLASACGAGNYSLVLVYPDQSSYDQSSQGELFVGEGTSCGDLEQREARLRFDPHGSGPALGKIQPGQVSFAVRVRDVDCALILKGCVEAEIRRGTDKEVRVVLTHADESRCDSGQSCQLGRCVTADGGGVDSSVVDAAVDGGGRDTGTDGATPADASSTDLALLDVAGADLVATDGNGTDAVANDATIGDGAGLDSGSSSDSGPSTDSGVAGTSTITGTGPVVADGVAASTITITLLDALSQPVIGRVPTFTSDGHDNTILNNCTASSSGGVSTCIGALRSTRAETKHLVISSPSVVFGGSVEFVAGPAVVATSRVQGSSPVVADGQQASTVVVSLRDAHDNPVVGVQPVIDATGTAVQVSQTCSATASDGTATCPAAVRSTVAETKRLRLTAPVDMDGDTVDFVNLPVPARGYTQRPCGFDMNHDGIIGGPEDCDVCDGQTTDPDHDGQAEDLIYVDAVNGHDSTGTGSPTSPYRTIAKAMNVANGPGVGAEDILCLRGTFRERIDLLVSGQGPAYQRGDIELPLNPMMIVGWDTDNDGQYPPYDSDDVVLLDGDGAWNSGFNAAGPAVSYIEVAHLVALKFTNIVSSGSDAFYFAHSEAGPISHHYLHDIEADQINVGTGEQDNDDHGVAVGAVGTNLAWHITIDNNQFTRAGATVFEAWAEDEFETSRNLFYGHNTVTLEGRVGVNAVFSRMFVTDHVSIIDNVVLGRPAAWGGGETSGILISDCTVDTLITRNQFIDVQFPLDIDADVIGCDEARPIDAMVDGNIISNQYYSATDMWWGIYLHSAHDAGPSLGDLLVYNNVITATPGHEFKSSIYLAAGNTTSTQWSFIVVAGNTFCGSTGGSVLLDVDSQTYLADNVFILNNIFACQTGSDALTLGWVPGALESNGNVFEAPLINSATLTDWRTSSGQDQNSANCSPAFVTGSPVAELSSLDTCARGVGDDITWFTDTDVDGEPRPQSGGIAGANVDPGAVDVVFQDHFVRTTADTVGRGWLETESNRFWYTWMGSLGSDDGVDPTAPFSVQRSFVPRTSGRLHWSFLLAINRASQTRYVLDMQLGSADAMLPNNPDPGAAVYLRWGGTYYGLPQPAGLGVVETGGVTQFDILDNDLVVIDVFIELDARTYDVYTWGNPVASDVAFFADVPIDTIRFFSDAGRMEIDIDAIRIEVP